MVDETKITQIVQASTMPEFNIKDNWKLWSERLELHFLEIGIKEENKKVSTLLKTIGSDAYEMLHSICSPALPSNKTYKELGEIMDKHFTPPVVVFHERKIFHAAKMMETESVAAWFAKVKKLTLNCKFGTNLESFVIDKFVVELPTKIFEKICEEKETLTIDEAFKKALLHEHKIATKTNVEVNYVNSRPKNNNNRSRRKKHNNNKNAANGNHQKRTACTRCGWKNHEPKDCKHKISKCHSCSQVGHLATVCSRNVQFIDSTNNDDDFTNNYFNSIYSISYENDLDYGIFNSNGNVNHYGLNVQINKRNFDVVVDTGAPCSLMPVNIFDRFFDRSDLKPCTVPYTGYGGELIDIVGEYQARIDFDGQSIQHKIVITSANRPILLGRTFLRGFGFELVRKGGITSNNSATQINSVSSQNEIIEQIKTEFAEVFKSGLGKFNVTEIDLPIDKNAVPIFCKPRPVPLAWRDKIGKQIDSLVECGMLVSVDSSE